MTVGSVRVYLRRSAAHSPRDRSLINDAVAHELSRSAAEFIVAAQCARCGSSEHGAPIVRWRSGSTHKIPHVSLSRCDDIVAVALSDIDVVGIDIENIERVGQARVDAVFLHANERISLHHLDETEGHARRATLWAAKESILKASGHGLTIDPDRLSLDVHGDTVSITVMPEELGFSCEPTVTVTRLLDRYVCAITSGTEVPRTFSWVPRDGVPPFSDDAQAEAS